GVGIGQALGDDRVVPHPIANCSITRLSLEDGRLVLLEAAATGHLPAELLTGGQSAMMGNR
ncbi:MAG: hypothetical protein WEC33_01700, partial [Dehalococcoidia bacterium]